MKMSQINENISDKEREYRKTKAENLKANYTQLKVYLEKGVAEKFDVYCKEFSFKKVDVIRELISAELESARRSKGAGRIGRKILGKTDEGAEGNA